MAQTAVTIHTIICDVCGKTLKDEPARSIALDADIWDIDLCKADAAKLARDLDKWTQKGRKRATRARRRNTEDEWAYLESRGFKRHRGRKSAEELAALASR